MFLLLVTWFYYNQPPKSSEASFGSLQACQVAQRQLLNDAKRLNADRDAQVQRDPNYNPIPAPTVSAVCVKR